jgi:hypothetical protein
MAVASKKEYVWLGIIGVVLIAAVLLVHRHADTITVVVMSVLVARRKPRSTTSGQANHRGRVAGK